MATPLIVTRLECGLGNQFFQYAAGRAISHRLGGTLHLDAQWFQGKNREYELNAFRIAASVCGKAETLRVRLSAGQRDRARYLRAVMRVFWPGYILPCLFDAEAEYDPRLADVKGSVYLYGFWQSALYFQSIRDQLLAELDFKDPPNPINQEMLKRIGDTHSVAVHIRRGDYLRADVGPHYFCGIEYYQAAIELVRSRLKSPSLYVFSDDPDWAAENLQTDLPMTLVRHNTGRDSNEDLRLMKACRHFVIANSTFSWWGAWLSQNPDKLVFCPEKWFKQPLAKERDMIPADWIRVTT